MNWVDKLNLATMLLMEVFLIVALLKAGNDKRGLDWLIFKAFFLIGATLFGMYLLRYAVAPRDLHDSSTTMTSREVIGQGPEEAHDDGSRSSAASEPGYADPRWPTANTELLAIPEADRWYNSSKQVNSYGTIAGPVASVAYLDDRVMVNIGADYPDPNRAQIVIWAERWDDFKHILNGIDYGNAWVSVSGKIKEFDGVAEIDVNDSDTEWIYWTED